MGAPIEVTLGTLAVEWVKFLIQYSPNKNVKRIILPVLLGFHTFYKSSAKKEGWIRLFCSDTTPNTWLRKRFQLAPSSATDIRPKNLLEHYSTFFFAYNTIFTTKPQNRMITIQWRDLLKVFRISSVISVVFFNSKPNVPTTLDLQLPQLTQRDILLALLRASEPNTTSFRYQFVGLFNFSKFLFTNTPLSIYIILFSLSFSLPHNSFFFRLPSYTIHNTHPLIYVELSSHNSLYILRGGSHLGIPLSWYYERKKAFYGFFSQWSIGIKTL